MILRQRHDVLARRRLTGLGRLWVNSPEYVFWEGKIQNHRQTDGADVHIICANDHYRDCSFGDQETLIQHS